LSKKFCEKGESIFLLFPFALQPRCASIEKPGFDMMALWARSGLMDAVYDAEGQPALSVAGMGDHPSAMALFSAIMLALYQRERTGRGAKVSNPLVRSS
jgi:crotonobetainyl-CoA:carnitine CoA-transferase CaiB-like acyl-CoA transferase